MIRLENIHKVFESASVKTVSLQNICLDIKKGEFVSIMGPSGSGKTTLLNIIGLLDAPTEGRMLLDDVDVYKLTESERTQMRRHHLGFVFQAFNLIDELTVFQNVELPLKLQGVPLIERRVKVRDMLRRLGISHRADMYPMELSGGQQQRTAIARAVIGNPKLILADEPTGNLDSSQGQEVMNLLTELHDTMDTTIVMVTHNHRDAAYADRTIELLDGRITALSEN